jgi:hypothetical protein
MKYTLIFFCLVISFASFGQPIVGRSAFSITAQDPNLSVTNSLIIPRFTDTASANNKGLDSSGKIIWTRIPDAIWYRSANKRWLQISGSGGSSASAWGTIAGTLSAQTDLQSALNLKLNKTDTVRFLRNETDPLYTANGVPKTRTIIINGTTIYLNKDSSYTTGVGSVGWGAITGTLASQTDLQNLLNTKLTSSSSLNPVNVSQTSSYRFVTDIEKALWSNKQSTIPLGSTSQYLKGDLSLGTFPTAVSSFSNDAGYASKLSTFSTKTTSFTFTLSDTTSFIDATSASPIVATIPPNSSVNFQVGQHLIVSQSGSGQITFAAGAGVVILSAGGSLSTRVQYSTIDAIQKSTNTWQLVGDLQ